MGRDGAAPATADRLSASTRTASAGLSTGCRLLFELALGPRAGAPGDRLLDDGLVAVTPLRGSSVTVDPIDVVAVVPVAPLDVGAEVDTPTENPLDGGSSEPAAAVAEDVVSVAEDVGPVDEVLPIDGGLPVDDVADASVADESESVGSAHATAGVVAIAMPTPNATANPPTRPIYLALLMVVPLASHASGVVTCCAAQAPR